MTCDAVFQSGYLLLRLILVAFQTPSHIHIHDGMDGVHLLDHPVATLTIQTRTEVRLMGEEHKIRLVFNTSPGNHLSSFPVREYLLDSRPICGNCPVASDAFLDRGDTRSIRPQGIRVTIQTGDTSCVVPLMTEGNGLIRRCSQPAPGPDHPPDNQHPKQ